MRRRALQQANFCTVSLSLSLSSFFFLVFFGFFVIFGAKSFTRLLYLLPIVTRHTSLAILWHFRFAEGSHRTQIREGCLTSGLYLY